MVFYISLGPPTQVTHPCSHDRILRLLLSHLLISSIVSSTSSLVAHPSVGLCLPPPAWLLPHFLNRILRLVPSSLVTHLHPLLPPSFLMLVFSRSITLLISLLIVLLLPRSNTSPSSFPCPSSSPHLSSSSSPFVYLILLVPCCFCSLLAALSDGSLAGIELISGSCQIDLWPN